MVIRNWKQRSDLKYYYLIKNNKSLPVSDV